MNNIFPKIKKNSNIFKQRKALGSKVKFKTKCKETLSNFDMFGENVKLTYKGKETFTTSFGSLLSLIILIMLLSFSGYKLFILISRNNPDVSQQ